MGKSFNRLPRFAIIFIITLVSVVTVSSLSCSPGGYSIPADSIVVALPRFESDALIIIADEQRFFPENNLDVHFRSFDTGRAALDGLSSGQVDIAGASEFPVVGKVFKGEGIRIIGCVDKADYVILVGRKDRGIEEISDLKGKTVGTLQGTIMEFYLGRFLNINGMDIEDIALSYLNTSTEVANSVIEGSIDAIVINEPFAGSAKDGLGANAVSWQVQSSQPMYGLLVSNDQWIKEHAEMVTRFLKSLAQAEDYIINNPTASKVIMGRRLSVDSSFVEAVWSRNQYLLCLDHSLVTAMEDEARWMIKNNRTTENTVPNFADYIYEIPLKGLKPEAVNIIR